MPFASLRCRRPLNMQVGDSRVAELPGLAPIVRRPGPLGGDVTVGLPRLRRSREMGWWPTPDKE